MPKVFTGFLIGTSHNTLEPYNVLVRLYNQVIADGHVQVDHAGTSRFLPGRDGKDEVKWHVGNGTIDPATGIDTVDKEVGGTALPPPFNGTNASVKMVLRGPGSSTLDKKAPGAKKGWKYTPNKLVKGRAAAWANNYYERKSRSIQQAINKFCTTNDPGNPDIINLVGHSRGAILAVIVAALFRDDNTKWFNLFLIDPVRNARKWGLDGLKDQDCCWIYDNTKDVKWIAMENEDRDGIFPFQFEIKRATPTGNNRSPYRLSDIPFSEIIRLPGTHGTATQCNPISSASVKTPSIEKSRLRTIWPVGYTTEILAAQWLIDQGRGTAFHPPNAVAASNLHVTDSEIIYHYMRIRESNARDSAAGVTLVNDIDVCAPGVPQITKKPTDQPAAELQALCPNPYYDHDLIVNEQHAWLIDKFLQRVLLTQAERQSATNYMAQIGQPGQAAAQITITQNTDTQLNNLFSDDRKVWRKLSNSFNINVV